MNLQVIKGVDGKDEYVLLPVGIYESLREQIEDILRKSAARTKAGTSSYQIKVDDKLVGIFSRDRRGRKKKVKKVVKKGKK